ncbi:hypothetical protein F2Q69_00045992 [Brassica cretica]|uniref:Uncharacterized protein n=1 Tax=Brassica cretica TaxID=69181 RepID=A0A8S9PSA7_BRACR|nr:hypothetical protein F2Q69_00045992 [Brassica cretica]
MAGNVKWVRCDLREIASKGRRECMDNYRIDVSEELGRYVAAELRLELGRYVATELRLELGRYVATEQTNARSLRTDRASARARSLRSDPFRAYVQCFVFPPQSFS